MSEVMRPRSVTGIVLSPRSAGPPGADLPVPRLKAVSSRLGDLVKQAKKLQKGCGSASPFMARHMRAKGCPGLGKGQKYSRIRHRGSEAAGRGAREEL